MGDSSIYRPFGPGLRSRWRWRDREAAIHTAFAVSCHCSKTRGGIVGTAVSERTRILLARLRDEEDHFVERKTVSDINDCVNTVVAFANSAPVGWRCVLYVGVREDGRFEEKQVDYDSIQKSVNNKLRVFIRESPTTRSSLATVQIRRSRSSSPGVNRNLILQVRRTFASDRNPKRHPRRSMTI